MRTLFIDDEFKLHTDYADGRTPVETDNFDGFCDEYIKGHIYVPEGMIYKKSDMDILHGPFIQPWKDHSDLMAFQMQYEYEASLAKQRELTEALAEMNEAIATEQEKLADAENALAILLGGETA